MTGESKPLQLLQWAMKMYHYHYQRLIKHLISLSCRLQKTHHLSPIYQKCVTEDCTDNANLKLMVAAQEGCLSTLAECLANGQDVNTRDLMFDETALMRACRYGHMDAVKYLLSCGAHVNATTESGMSALHIAVLNQHVQCVKFLLKYTGIEKDIQHKNPSTPLMMAAERGYARVVQLLLSHGCNPDVVNAAGQTSLHASLMPYRGIVGNWDGYTCLRILVEHGSNVNATDQKGMTAAHCAVQRGNKWALSCLVCANCDMHIDAHGWTVDTCKEFGRHLKATPLTMAVYYLNEYMVSLLYRGGCDMSQGKRMLPYAAKSLSLYELLFAAIATPRTLKDACKFVIRASIGLGVQTKVNCLDIPESLKLFILLTELQVSGKHIKADIC